MSENVGTIEYTVTADTAALMTAGRSVDSINGSMQAGFNRTDASVSNLTGSFGKLSAVAASLMAILSSNEILKYSDAWTNLNNKLVNSVSINEQLIDVTTRVFNISQDTRSSIDATATLYGRLERSTRKYNLSAEQLVSLTTTINKGLIVSGATTEEAASTMTQLSQALASGALRGEEFNSLTENGSRLAMALADSLGVDIGQLRTMSAAGAITTKVVVDGLLKQGVVIGEEFAKTTRTIGQSFTVATNNITKFVGESSTVQSTVAGIGSAVVTVSENLDVLTNVFIALTAVMGSRFLGAMVASTREMAKNAIGALSQTKAFSTASQAALIAATSATRKAVADKEAALSAVALAQAEYNVAKGSLAEATALQNLTAKKTQLSAASLELVLAEKAQAAATLTATAATRAASVAMTTFKTAMSLLGGPAGVIMLAAAALYIWYQNSQQAKQEAIAFADSVDALSTSFTNLNHAQLEGTQAKLEESVIAQKDAISDLQSEVDKTTAVMSEYKTQMDGIGQSSPAYAAAQDRYSQSVRDNKTAVADLDAAQGKLSATSALLAKVNDRLATGMDVLSAKAKQLRADMVAITSSEEDVGASAKAIKKADDEIEKLAGNTEIAKLQQKGLTEQAAAYAAILPVATEAGSKYAAQVGEIAGNLEAAANSTDPFIQKLAAIGKGAANLSKIKLDTKVSTKGDSKAESEAKRRADQLKELQNSMAVTTLEMQGQARAAAQLAAVQKLGAGATQSEIDAAKQQAGAIFDVNQQIKDQQALIENNPVAKENKSFTDSKAQLERQKGMKDSQGNLLMSEAQYYQQSEQLAVQHQQNMAKIISQQAVTPQQSAAGDVDPVQALANENAQKIALIKAYEGQRVISATTADQLIAAEQTKYDQQRLAAIETQYRAQSALNDFTMSMIDSVGQRFGNMVVGMATGTQSVSDAMRNLAATILDQAVGALVQMGVQALKNMIIGQTASTASMAQAAVTGPAIAAAYAPAAAMASLASFGANAAPAQVGIASTVALSQGLSMAGGRRYGGGVSAGNAYRINESGQSEVFQTSGGAQAFIPNKSGKVIPADEAMGGGSSPVNVVINNMASGTQVENQGYNPDTKTITLAVKEVARQIRNGSGDVSRAMKDSWNVTSKSQ